MENFDWKIFTLIPPTGSPFGEGVDDGGTGSYTGGSEGDQGGNPAWQPLLQELPPEYHEKVTPFLQQWDQGVNKRFETVQSEYKPWEPVVKGGHDPQTALMGLNLLSLIQADPMFVVNQIQKHYPDQFSSNGTSQDAGAGQGQESPDDNPYKEHFDRLESQQRKIAEHLLSQQQQKQQAADEAEYDKILQGLEKDHGPFNVQMVNALVASGVDPADAVKQYKDWERSAAINYNPAPRVLGGGGGMPNSTKVNPSKLNEGEFNQLGADLLRQANRARQQG